MTRSEHGFYPPTQPLLIPVIFAIENLVVTIWPAHGEHVLLDAANRRMIDALRLSLAAFQCTFEQFEHELAFLARFGDRPHSAGKEVDFILDVRRNSGLAATDPATSADVHALRHLLTRDEPQFVDFLEARRSFNSRKGF